jgi:hypothetical protein
LFDQLTEIIPYNRYFVVDFCNGGGVSDVFRRSKILLALAFALRVEAGFLAATRPLRVAAAFFPAARRSLVFEAFLAAARDFRVFAAFLAADFLEADFDTAMFPLQSIVLLPP